MWNVLEGGDNQEAFVTYCRRQVGLGKCSGAKETESRDAAWWNYKNLATNQSQGTRRNRMIFFF